MQPTSAASNVTKLSPAARQVILAHANADVWAAMLALKIDGRNWDLANREYLRDVYRDNAQWIVCRKAAQMGFTVAFLVKTLHRVLEWHWNGLYLLPTKVGVVPFVQGRFNPMIDDNQLIKTKFSQVDSVTHKRTTTNNLYFRGTNVQTDLREIPVDFEIWDERDKMASENLPLARTRMDGSAHKHLTELSTPTVEDWGIDAAFKDTDQRHWFIPCVYCGTSQALLWETHVHIGDTDSLDACKKTTEIRCEHCHKKWSHAQIMDMAQKGIWAATIEGREGHGYYINQLVSPTRTISELAEIWYQGEIRGKMEEAKELWNSALGLPWAAPGDRLTIEALDAAREQGYHMPGISNASSTRPISIGIDVGKYLHVTAMYGHGDEKRRVMDLKVMGWEDLKSLLIELSMRKIYWTGVMDANPEKFQAEAIASMFPNQLWLAYYADPKNMSTLADWSPVDPFRAKSYASVRIDRTMAIDTAHQMLLRKRIVLPTNARALVNSGPDYGDFYAQMTAQTAITQPDSMGNPRRIYVHPEGRADHFDHSFTYCVIASLMEPAHQQFPEEIGVHDLPQGPSILEEVGGLFVQDDDGMEFDGFFSDLGRY